jgi:hypothetical protein
MGANAVTTVPVYTAGEVLTAADMNITNSGIPVFATTVTRDAAFGGAGEKTLAEGQFAYIEATNTTQYYDGAAWQSVGVAPGLVLVKSQVIGSAVASVTVTDAFSSAYDNYKITVSGGVGSTNQNLGIQLGATTTGYYYSYIRTASYASAAYDGQVASNTTSFVELGYGTTDTLYMSAEIINPNLAKPTFANGAYVRGNTTGIGAGTFTGFLSGSTQYTAFSLLANTGTMTGGTIRVYGYSTV